MHLRGGVPGRGGRALHTVSGGHVLCEWDTGRYPEHAASVSGRDNVTDCRCTTGFCGEDRGECSVCPAKSYCEGGKSVVSCGEHLETSVPLSLSLALSLSLDLREHPGIESPEVVVHERAVFDQHRGVVVLHDPHTAGPTSQLRTHLATYEVGAEPPPSRCRGEK